MHQWCFISFLVLVAIRDKSSLAITEDNYMHARLEDFCYSGGAKREVGFRSNVPHRYVFNSSLSTAFKCHLELELRTAQLGSGFSVFIESMNLESNADCSRDWLQFGKDVLFITTRKSKKFCERIPPLIPRYKENTLPDGFEPDTYKGSRMYKEHANEMDVWIMIHPSRAVKELVLVVTPHISCTKHNAKFKACPNSSECVAKNLFCDGRVNCISNNLDEDSRFCPSIVPGGIGNSGLGLPLVLIISVGIILFCIFIFFVMKECVHRIRRRGEAGEEQNCTRTTPNNSRLGRPTADESLLGEPPQRGRARGGGVIGLEERLTEPVLPPSPPPYSEVVGIQDEPPKYDDIHKIEQTIV